MSDSNNFIKASKSKFFKNFQKIIINKYFSCILQTLIKWQFLIQEILKIFQCYENNKIMKLMKFSAFINDVSAQHQQFVAEKKFQKKLK